MNAIYLPMIFICGVFFSADAFPGFLEAIANVLPLTYLLELVRDLFVEGERLVGDGRWPSSPCGESSGSCSRFAPSAGSRRER